MKQRPRIYYTESQKKLMCDHWQKGNVFFEQYDGHSLNEWAQVVADKRQW